MSDDDESYVEEEEAVEPPRTAADSKLARKFVVQRDGREFVLYAGLLDLAHQEGLEEITTTLVQIPNEMNGMTAICHATVTTSKGRYSGVGDACPTNVTRMMAPHLIRMAETRAKARALRDAVNVGMASIDEVEDGHAPRGDSQPSSKRPEGAAPTPIRPVPSASAPSRGSPPAEKPGQNVPERRPAATSQTAGPPATPKQLETIQRMARVSGKSVETDGLTRSAASEIISNLIGELGTARNG
jgi:hypothetical protein